MTDMEIVFILTTHLQFLSGVLFDRFFSSNPGFFIITLFIVYGIGVFLKVIIYRLYSIIP